jgi:hypothetical protein
VLSWLNEQEKPQCNVTLIAVVTLSKRAMRTLLASLLVICIIAGSCQKEDKESDPLKATVYELSDISCSAPVLDFSEDSVKIRQFTGLPNLRYVVVGLPSEHFILGKKLFVSLRLLRPEEDFPCNTLGLSYPHIKVVTADSRN